jgi:hypothetical protein
MLREVRHAVLLMVPYSPTYATVFRMLDGLRAAAHPTQPVAQTLGEPAPGGLC